MLFDVFFDFFIIFPYSEKMINNVGGDEGQDEVARAKGATRPPTPPLGRGIE